MKFTVQTDYFNKIFLRKTPFTGIQFIRYGISGGLAFTIDFLSLIILTEYYDLHYLISAAIAFTMGLIIIYLISIFWIFDKRRFANNFFEILIFSLIGIGGIVLNEIFIWLFTEIFLAYYLISKVISTLLIYPYNFFTKKYLLFS